jgi:hypothetical protein
VRDARGTGDDGSMTPEEAERFYEADEDPEKIFTAFDAAQKGVTGPTHARRSSASSVSIYAVARGLYGELRQKLLPEVSAAGHRCYISGHA